MNTNDCRFSKE